MRETAVIFSAVLIGAILLTPMLGIWPWLVIGAIFAGNLWFAQVLTRAGRHAERRDRQQERRNRQ